FGAGGGPQRCRGPLWPLLRSARRLLLGPGALPPRPELLCPPAFTGRAGPGRHPRRLPVPPHPSRSPAAAASSRADGFPPEPAYHRPADLIPPRASRQEVLVPPE